MNDVSGLRGNGTSVASRSRICAWYMHAYEADLRHARDACSVPRLSMSLPAVR